MENFQFGFVCRHLRRFWIKTWYQNLCHFRDFQTSVSIKRLRTFLINEELDPDNVESDKATEGAIHMAQASFRWDADEETPTIRE